MQDFEQVVPSRESTEAQISKLAEISREMVRLYKSQFGRGPTTARSDLAGPDLIICTLEDSLTPAEKRMAELGDHQSSGMDTDKDVAAELFYLED